jgi:choice-of-anchor B domain-containing protein
MNIPMKPSAGLLILALLFATNLSAQTSMNMEFLGNKNDYPQPNGALGYSACWGYTAPDGREYAILGTLNGTSIVDITDAPTLREVSFIPGLQTSWREMKTHKQYAFIVTDNTPSGPGVQIVDLSALPTVAKLVKTFAWIDTINGNAVPSPSVHSVSVSENFLYLNGGGSNGIRILDIHDPLNPVQVGKYSTTYVHDSHIRRDTIFASTIGANGLDIVDARKKSSPVLIKRIQYVGSGTHNAWTTQDRKYVITTDEVGSTPKSLKVWDIRDMQNVSKVAEFSNSAATVHNVFIKGNLAYVAWYADGLKVVDVSNPLNPQVVGFYDTYPQAQTTSPYVGAWGADPYFPSGKVIISDMQTGLYVVRYTGDKRGIVSGVVTDAATGAPLPDVLLHFKDAAITRFSGAYGQYIFGYAPGTFEVTIEKPGYVTKQQTITVVEGSTTTVNVTLTNPATAVEQAASPAKFSLSQNYPNPFNPTTTIGFTLDREEEVVLKVFNLFGEEVQVLVNERRTPGNYAVTLDGTMLPSGVYYYQLTAGDRTSARKMVLMK